MSKNSSKTLNWIIGGAAAYFVGSAIAGAVKRKSVAGIGYANTPNYSLGMLTRYLSSHQIFDAQVVLNDRNKYGHYYVLCGDDQGGRDFYLSPKNLPYFRAYCERNGIDYEEFYLPEDALSGIGAAKRRIYKEISLAQQAGVDFTKKYDELTDDEIEALQRVSNDTGFTETYYKGLKKAYDAISGIGEAYDVADENGNTVLTWIEDPELHVAYEDPERYRALLEARAIDEDRQYASENKSRELEEREKRLAASRKRLSRDGRASQMALFGCGTGALRTEELLEPELMDYLRTHLDDDEVSSAMYYIDQRREPLYVVNPDLSDQIHDMVDDWCTTNAIDPDSVWSVVDEDDILFAL